MATMLRINNLSVGFKHKNLITPAVKSVSLELHRGESLGIVGESGSGKSITALTLMGLLPPQGIITEGNILLNGQDLSNMDKAGRNRLRGKQLSMIFQEPMTSLNPVMRCGKQVAESIKLHQGLSMKLALEKTEELFRQVKLPRPKQMLRAYPHELSGGQKQRVMIAMAIANDPMILIADEPTTALDVTVQKEILELLNQLRIEKDMAMIFISHDLGVVSRVADKVAVMYRGDIVEQGDCNQVFNHPVHPYTKGLLACRPPLNSRPDRLPVIADFLEKHSTQRMTPTPTHTSVINTDHALLDVRNLWVSYALKKNLLGRVTSRVDAVKQASFQVYPGETLGLVGESGCGKTTLGRSILRLIQADEGLILFNDQNLGTLSAEKMRRLRRDINIVFQDPYSSLNPRLSIGQAIMEPMKVHGLHGNNRNRHRKASWLLEKVGLLPEHMNRFPHEFSGGQRQRIVIARALAVEPRFIVCDEAVSALDVSVQAMVLNLLNDLKKEFSFTYIFISHDLSVVHYMSDRIMVMKDGEIIEVGQADQVFHYPKEAYTKKLIAAIPTLKNN